MTNDQILEELHKVQVEILQVIDGVCRRNGLRYSLYAGTLLGAVRHKGFIPWDDDLDICMPRDDYEKLIAIWAKEAPGKYLLQNKDTDPDFTQTFTKIRKDHTTFLQEGEEHLRYHKGIFVDIFPVDRMPEGTLNRLLFYWNGFMYLLYTREFIPPKGSIAVKVISTLLLEWSSPKTRAAFRKTFERKLMEYDRTTSSPVVMTETFPALKTHYAHDLLDSYCEITFEEKSYMAFGKWHEMLTVEYGDYMELPPEKERIWSHHPLALSFDHDHD